MRSRVIAFLAAWTWAGAEAATLEVTVTDVPNDHGFVRVLVCDEATFGTKHCPFSQATPAVPGHVSVRVEGLAAGEYAVQAFQDEQGTGRLRKDFLGKPVGEVGYSRDAKVRWNGVRFSDAAIVVADPSTQTNLRLRHADR